MADNIQLDTPSAAGDVIKADDITTYKIPGTKIVLGADGVDGDYVTTSNPFPIIAVANSGVDIGDVSINNGTGASSVPVQGAAAADAPVAGNPVLIGARASAAAPTDVSADGDAVPLWTTLKGALHVADGGGTLSIDDGGGAITVDGTVGVSGTVTVDLGVNNDVTVTGTVTAELSATDNAVLDNIDADLTTIIGHVDGIETLIGTTNTTLTTIDGRVDGIEGILTTIDADTGAIAAGFAAEAAALGSGVLIQGDDGTDRTNVLVDTDGHLQVDVLSGGGGGTQYTEGDTDASITGGAILWEDTGDTLRAVSAAKPLPVELFSAASPGSANSPVRREDDASASGDAGIVILGRNTTSASTSALSGTNGDYEPLQLYAGTLMVTLSNFANESGPVRKEDEAYANGNGLMVAGVKRSDTPATTTGADNDLEPPQMADGALWTMQKVASKPSAGTSLFRSLDLDESEEEVKASAGYVYGIQWTNTATATRWLKLYNGTAASVSVGTTTPVYTLGLPGNASDDVTGVVTFDVPMYFSTAICAAATTGVADSDTGAPAANDVIVNIQYA